LREHPRMARVQEARSGGGRHAVTERIQANPQIHFGKPCVAGTRIPVVDVLELISQGLSFQEITQNYFPDLTADDIRACVRYAIEVLGAEELHIATTP